MNVVVDISPSQYMRVATRLKAQGHRVDDRGECLLICRLTKRSRWSEPTYVSKQGITQAKDPIAYTLEAIGENT